jgi:MoaA/NifB/PqqE/SkfB family radical SAM enzyme
MTADQLESQLIDRFELVCFEDLADYRGSHRAIFDLFKQHRRDVFEPEQRLIFYSTHEPEQSFLNHIQYAAARIDISNFFILIVTPYDLQDKLKTANALHGHDDQIIQSLVSNLENTKSFDPAKYAVDRNSLCVFPFMELDQEMEDRVLPCCKIKGSVGNLKQQSWSSIFYGKNMEDLRTQMRQGIRPDNCKVCWDTESTNTTSLRKHGLEQFGDQLDQGWLDDPRLRSIHVSFSNICNFTCRICGPLLSSKIAVEEIKHASGDRKAQLKNALAINKAVFDLATRKDMEDSFKDVEVFHVAGGEPFLHKQLAATLTKIIEFDFAKKIKLDFNTNGSVYPVDIIELIQQFKSVEILISIDDIGPRFELQRGGQWNQVLHNLHLFSQLKSDRINVKFGVTVNIQNLLYLDQVIDFSNSMGFEIVWTYVEKPLQFSINQTTQKVKDIVWNKYAKHPSPELQAIANRVVSTPPVSGDEFLQQMKLLDSRRSQDFWLHHSEIAEAMSCP